MISIKFIRDNIELVKESLLARKSDIDLDSILELDNSRRSIIKSVEALKADRNYYSKEIAKQKQAGKNCDSEIKNMQKVSSTIKSYDLELKEVNDKLKMHLLLLPNIPHISVPRGKTEEDNVLIKEWGEKPSFSFPQKDHVSLSEKHNLIDHNSPEFFHRPMCCNFKGIGRSTYYLPHLLV